MTISRVRVLLIIAITAVSGSFAFSAELNGESPPCYEAAVEAFVYTGIIRGDLQLRWYVSIVGDRNEGPPVVKVMVNGLTREPEKSGGFQNLPDTRTYRSGSVLFGERWLNLNDGDTEISVLIENPTRPDCTVLRDVKVPGFSYLERVDLDLLSGEGLVPNTNSEGVSKYLETIDADSRAAIRERLLSKIRGETAGNAVDAINREDGLTSGALFREYHLMIHGDWSPSCFPVGPISGWKSDHTYFQVAKTDLYNTSGLVKRLEYGGAECLLLVKSAGNIASFGPTTALDDALDVGREGCREYPVSLRALESARLVAHGVLARNVYGWLVPIREAPK